MSDKIKISIGLLAVLALVSFLSLLDIVGFGEMPSLASVLGQSALGPVDGDIDGDGLLNADESYWNTDFKNPDTDGDGLLDGEEVDSGHDPLVMGPDDILLSQENMTQRLSSLAIAGIYAGDLSIDNPSFESSLSVLTDTIIDETLEGFLQDIDTSEIKVIPSSKLNQEEYLRNISLYMKGLTEAHSSQLKALSEFSQNKNNSKLTETLASANSRLNSFVADLHWVEVPENWENPHLSIMAWAKSLASAGNSIISTQEDPIKGAVALTTLLNGYLDLEEIVNRMQSLVKSQGLSVSTQ